MRGGHPKREGSGSASLRSPLPPFGFPLALPFPNFPSPSCTAFVSWLFLFVVLVGRSSAVFCFCACNSQQDNRMRIQKPALPVKYMAAPVLCMVLLERSPIVPSFRLWRALGIASAGSAPGFRSWQRALPARLPVYGFFGSASRSITPARYSRIATMSSVVSRSLVGS